LGDKSSFQYKQFIAPIKKSIISEEIFEQLIRLQAERLWYQKKLYGEMPSEYYRNTFIFAKFNEFKIEKEFEKIIASQIWRNFLNCLEFRAKDQKIEFKLPAKFVEMSKTQKEEIKKCYVEKMVDFFNRDIVIANIKSVVFEFCQKSSPSLSSVLLFQFLVAFLSEDASLGIDLGNDNSNDEVKSVLRRIYLSICSYSEGIYQLIENTCIHSDTHCGFLSMKIHSTTLLKTSSTRTLIKNAHNVSKLSSKYKTSPESNENPLGAKYHLEIRINDISENGVVETYLKNHPIVDNKRPTLSNFFEDYNEIIDASCVSEQEREDTIINHYGLRLLNRIIKVNDGDFVVNTVDGCDGMFHSLYPHSNYEKQTYGTEYSILLPLSLQSYENFSPMSGDVFKKNQLISQKSNVESIVSIHPIKSDTLDQTLSKEKMVLEIFHNMFQQIKDAKNSYNDADILAGLENEIVSINLCNYNIFEIELFAKALMRLIAYIYFITKKEGVYDDHKANFAIHFGENCELKIYEFVRIFSIFYTKGGIHDEHLGSQKDGTNEWMEGIQIALCSSDNYLGDKKFNAVNFIIAGKNIESARLTALAYAYYNSNLTLKYISAIRYFTRTANLKVNSQETVNPSIVPFDLFLSGENTERVVVDKNNSWFINQIKHILGTSIQNADYGCKNEDIHIKIGSKIHISDFYEAELLFHNIANIEKFAYLISSEILNQSTETQRNILLIGYENYSESLILKIKDNLLMHKDRIKSVNYSIYYKKDGEDGPEELLTNHNDIESFFKKRKSEVVSIMPIGTTLSTVHKIKNVLIRNIKKDVSIKIPNIWTNSVHYVIIEIRDSNRENDKKLSKQEEKYWSEVSKEKLGLIRLKSENGKNDTEGTRVQYLIDVQSDWQDASKCKYCLFDKKEDEESYKPEDYIQARILVDVDKTATIPCSIFKLKKPNNSGYDALCFSGSESLLKDEVNNERLSQFKNCITYAHIYYKHNHFQYYFNTQRYYRKIKKIKSSKINVLTWLKKVRKNLSHRIDNSFNIIVSPLKQTNSEFLNDVEKYVFNHNIRFLHFTLEDSYREEIRAKFSYITEEYKRIKKMNKYNKVNIFFVDDTITTGRTFQRARNYIRMLLTESGVFDNTQKVFDGIITLLNRNSYDTVCNYVSNPESDFFAYVHVAISSIKANSGYCPACKTADQFLLLKKRSSEYDMRREFERLVTKQRKRTVEEHEKWLDKEIQNRHGYFSWLKQWLYTYGNHEEPMVENVKVFIMKVYRDLLDGEKSLRGKKLELWNMLTLRKLKYIYNLEQATDITDELFWFEKQYSELIELLRQKKTDSSDIVDNINNCKMIVKEYAIPYRDYLRMLCSHKINLATEPIFKKLDSNKTRKNIGTETIKVILETLNADCGYYSDTTKFETVQDIISSETNNEILENARKIDTLISYIKTSSRPLPARYHNVEQAVFTIITAFAVAMLESAEDVKSNIVRISQKVIEFDEMYQIMFINIAKTFIDFNNNSIAANISPAHQFELFRVIMNRLGIMQSNFVTNKIVLDRLFGEKGVLDETRNDHNKYTEKNEDYAVFCEFPEDEWIVFAYRRMLMRLSMLSNNDSINIALDRILCENNMKEEMLDG